MISDNTQKYKEGRAECIKKIHKAKGNMKFMKKTLCLILTIFMMLSVLSIVPVQVFAASASDYIAQTYASSLSVRTTKTTSLMKYPTAESAYTEHTVPSGTMLTVKALHKDKSGKFWYQVLYYNLTLYVDATSLTMIDHLTGDVTATGLHSPASLTYGGSFPVRGTITSTLNDLGKVTVAMYKSNNLSRTPAISSSDTVNGKKYVLDSSTVDNNMLFGNLATGSYTYAVLADAVSYYINDSGALTTSTTEVVLQTKLCVVTTSANPNPVLHNGIDVSVWNGNIDWATVKSQIDFAILRASWEETADTKFYTNANGCVQNGIPFGVYVYSYAENAAEAKGEAEYVLSLVDGYDLDLPIFLDFEDEIQMNLSASLQQEVVKTFCDTIYAAGYQPGIYTYQWLLRSSTFSDSYYKTIPTWVAEIKSGYTNYPGGLWLWQYSWVGRFNGMSGDVDCNKMYVELPGTGSSDKSYLASCTYYPSNLMVTTNTETNMREYPSSDYTLLETIGSGTKLHVTGLYKNAYGNLWYQVERNGKTGYVYATDVNVNEYLYNDIAIRNVSMASNLELGKGYYIQGDLSSKYNNLATVYAKVYSGENTKETPTLTSSYSPNAKEYSLYKSEVDYGLKFGSQPKGYYTYEVSADVKNYYATDATTLASKTENVVVWTAPYTVDNATITPPNEAVCSHVIVVQPAVEATCTQAGASAGSYCSECGEVFASQQTVPAKGHNYTVVTVPSNCLDYEHALYSCTNCGDNYSTYLTEDNTSDWGETLPDGIPEKLYETKTQYRYSDYEQVQNYQSSMDGYTLDKKEWESQGQKTQECVKQWPEGFSTGHALYTTYNKTPKATTTATNTKTEVNSEAIAGYLYYHWCSDQQIAGGPWNRTTSKVKDDAHPGFHAFFDTVDPSVTDRVASDGSIIRSNASVCIDSYWYYNVPVYRQTYTEYKALYTHSRWGEWSEWSDTPVSATDTRKVETRTLYRYSTATLGEHVFEDGFCIHCSKACNHEWSDSVCTICSLRCDHKWHLGGCYVCGKVCNHYWVEGDCFLCGVHCEHSWNDGVCNTCKFKCSHDYKDGYCTICKRPCSPHNFVNGVCQICSLVCEHEHWYEGRCSTCGTSCDHNYSQGSCTNCGTLCVHSFTDGVCGICNLVCTHSWTDGECSICDVVCKHNWVDGKCSVCSKICYHDFKDGKCTICLKPCVHKWSNGHCQVCGIVCEHTWVDGKCTNCSMVCKHSYEDGKCTICLSECKHNWLAGKCTTCAMVCEHEFKDGKCTICAYICKHSYENGECTICDVVCEHNWRDGVCRECGTECEHSFSQGSCTICKTDCDHVFEDSTCTVCQKKCTEHSYIDGFCAICSKEKPPLFLYGFINGEEYGFGEDADNIGTYEFKDGSLVVTFTENSYVAVKDGDNENFYMTYGYQGDNVTLAVLYNTKLIGDEGDKLFVPKGREITFTLIDNGNDTLTLYYTAAPCEHTEHNTEGVCTSCDAQVDHTYSEGKCTVCSLECEHSFTNGRCRICGMDCKHNFEDSECTLCHKVCTHRFKDGICTVCAFECEHNFSDGRCTGCMMDCSHKFTDGVCTVCGYVCQHNYTDGVCSDCLHICEHTFREGICTNCRYICSHNFVNGSCEVCNLVCNHEFSDGECTGCDIGQFYLSGYINGESVGCDDNYDETGKYNFTDGELNITLTEDSYVFVKTFANDAIYMSEGNVSGISATLYNLTSGKEAGMFLLPGGTELSLTLFTGKNDTLALMTQVISCEHHKHNAQGKCIVCGEAAEHTYSAGKCTLCGAQKPEKDMYLFGYINGANYGCEEDGNNIGEYKFTKGTLTVTFTQDSYVAVKTADNSDWYMTNGWEGFDKNFAILYNTSTGIVADKLFVPGGVEVKFTLTNNSNDTFTLSYEAERISKAEILPKFSRLSTDGTLCYEAGFRVSNMEVSPENTGVAIYSDAEAETPTETLSGATVQGNYLIVKTGEIHPMELGDTVYFRIYAVLSDGTYVYSDMLSVNGVECAENVLRNPVAPKEHKALMVALLNFSAQAQIYFGYKTHTLANAGLEAEHRALVKKYNEAMLEDSVSADSAKTANFEKTAANALIYPTVSFEDKTFTINYNCIASGAQGDVILYYWDSNAYNTATTLTKDNATGVMVMSKDKNGIYTASVSGIEAKNADKTIYVSVVYTAGGKSHSTGVVSYSFADYCKLTAEKSAPAQELAQSAIVYSYYAKKLFA